MSTPAGDIADEVKTLLDTLLVAGGLCAVGYGYRTAKIFDLESGSPAYALSYEGHFERPEDQGDEYDFLLAVAARYSDYAEEQQAAATLMEIEHVVQSEFHRLGSYGTRMSGGVPLWNAVTFFQRTRMPASQVDSKGWRYMQIYMHFTR